MRGPFSKGLFFKLNHQNKFVTQDTDSGIYYIDIDNIFKKILNFIWENTKHCSVYLHCKLNSMGIFRRKESDRVEMRERIIDVAIEMFVEMATKNVHP